MAGWLSEDKRRNVIPRWREFNQTLELGELFPIKTVNNKDSGYIEFNHHKSKIIDWQTERTIKNAIELLNSSFIRDDLEYSEEAAKYLSLHSNTTSKSIQILSNRILKPLENSEQYNQISDFQKLDEIIKIKIHNLRVNLSNNQSNSINWIELARLYLILGKEGAAERCILVGVQLAPNNRYVSRVASRFFTHIGDYKKAKQILKSNLAFNVDPWLVGAEIGISSLQNKSSNSIKKARELVTSENYSSFELSELLSAMATEELNAGSIKSSRRLFNHSLINPNDNSLAQAVWAKKHVNDLNLFEITFDKVPNIYEARAYQHYYAKQWATTMSDTLEWFIDQPFSIDPASFGSFLASSILERYDEAIKLCKYGLKATPNNFTLMNNLAFSHLKIGDTKSASNVIHKIQIDSLTDQQKVVFLATKGLFMYKQGESKLGADLYNESSSLAEKLKDKKLKLLSDFHHLAIQLEIEGFPESKFFKIERLSKEVNELNEVYFNDLIKNLIKRKNELSKKT